MKRLFLLLITLYFSEKLTAQSYFQQEVNYTIQVALNDLQHELNANETIEYINHSPQTLSFIYMHLWPNAYKNNTTALAKQLLENEETKLYYATEDERGYIDGLDFKINGQPAKWELLKDSIDICKIKLNEPLKSGDKIIITTPFHVKIPSGAISRLGHIGQSYQITQWYPKPAVYDKTGWHQMPYLNQGEFYSEFGSFDVSITLPKNYVLGATGDMIDSDSELEWLNKKVKATEAISSFDSKDLAFPPSDVETKTIRFKQSNVHDFAWFCDKRYHVLKGEVTTPHTKNNVTTWVMFTNAEARLWKNSIQYMNDAIYYYSLWNGDYPYKNCTAVDGTISAGGGMEYPNITVIGSSQNAFQLEQVIIHEVGHNWFYGMLGSNERTHPWLDEGINSFNENRYIKTKYPEQKLIDNNALNKLFDLSRYAHKKQYELLYLLSAAKNEDQAIETPSQAYTDLNYGADVYCKTAIVLDYLMAYLGEAEMDKAMQAYFNEWHFKHPQPEDFRKSIEQTTGKNLGWLFDDLINSTKKVDYKIVFAQKNNQGYWDIGVKNKGEVNSPVFIQGIKNNKLVGEVIYDGFKGKQLLNFPASQIDYFKIDFREDIPEINRNNNKIKTKGLFKKVEPIQLQFLGSIDNPDKTQLFWLPAVGWNNYNKWMLGVAFYNNILPQKKFEFELMPLYSFATNDIAGSGNVNYHLFPKSNFIQHISIGIKTARYAYNTNPLVLNFNKIAPQLIIDFKKSTPRNPYQVSLQYRNISLIEDSYSSNYDFSPTIYIPSTTTKNFNDLILKLKKQDAIDPFNISWNLQQGEDIMKTSIALNYTHNYREKNKGFDVRFFAGTFLYDNSDITADYRFRLSGQTGNQDYLYDHIYLGRSEMNGVLFQQFTETDGGFKFRTALGQTSKWITTLSVKTSLGNMKLPLSLYADIGTTAKDALNDDKILYNAGVCVTIAKNIFEIYFPIVLSQDFIDEKNSNGWKYQETIRFTLNLNLMNPLQLVKDFKI